MVRNDCENDCEFMTTRVVMAKAGIGTLGLDRRRTLGQENATGKMEF